MSKQNKFIQRKDLGWLKDIFDASNSIKKITADITFDDFDSDMLKHLSVARLFEIIGEATKNLSNELRETHSNIPWKKMAGMRDILIHAYSEADNKIIWNSARNDIPDLIGQIDQIILHLENLK